MSKTTTSLFPFVLTAALSVALAGAAGAEPPARLRVSANGRFLETAEGRPFFWLADTAWLLATNLDRAEAARYLDDRAAKGFNVIQVMVLHTARDRNAYDMPALDDGDPGKPHVTPGNTPGRAPAYDYWDHLDWLVDEAGARGIYLALVPSWGSLAKRGELNLSNVTDYTSFLARRYRNRTNIVWLTGGDIQGNLHAALWKRMGVTLKQLAPDQLVTYHPFGRTDSSAWFHSEPWLDFNMFQSGHQSYEQDKNGFGEDNWRFVRDDYARKPVKPTLDGEPSYEGIPHGLHDVKAPRWTAADVRRYAYWSVFTGACGHTYGANEVMQMYKSSDGKGSYGPKKQWFEAIDDPGAGQMQYLKRLMLSRPFLARVPDEQAIQGEPGERYDRLIATRTDGSLLVYTYTGRPFEVALALPAAQRVKAWWYSPRDGRSQLIGEYSNPGPQRFTPPGEPRPGNDWVLVVDDVAKGFAAPGTSFVTQ